MWKKVAAQLQYNITQTINNLGKRSENMKSRMSQKQTKGLDISAIQISVTELDNQLAIIKSMVVPTNPTSGDALKTLQTSYKDARTAALKAASMADEKLRALK